MRENSFESNIYKLGLAFVLILSELIMTILVIKIFPFPQDPLPNDAGFVWTGVRFDIVGFIFHFIMFYMAIPLFFIIVAMQEGIKPNKLFLICLLLFCIIIVWIRYSMFIA